MAYSKEGLEKMSEEIENMEKAVPEGEDTAEEAVPAEEEGEEESAEEAADSAAEESDGASGEDDAQGEAAETEKEDAQGKSGEKRGFFKKKKDKRDEQIEELTDKVRRQMAEFDNFRKRTEKEKTQMYDMGAKTIVEKMLPVVDNFERGLAAVPADQKDDAFVTGMDKIYKQLMTELEAVGVTAIEAVGQEFNPEYHNAVMQVESGEYESGVVAQELQKGYLYKDSVVRHSMVAVVS